MSELPLTRQELQGLYDHFREFKHNLNNTLAVIMALSELSQRNPSHLEKLARTILQRGPEVVSQLNEFQAALGKPLTATKDLEDSPAEVNDALRAGSSKAIIADATPPTSVPALGIDL